MSERKTLKLLPGGIKDQEDKKSMIMAMLMSNTTYIHNVEFVENDDGVQIGAVISAVLNIDIEEE